MAINTRDKRPNLRRSQRIRELDTERKLRQNTGAATAATEYDNSSSGLSSDTVQGALDELAGASSSGGYSVLTNGNASSPELVFLNGDVIEVPLIP